jgi:hypothetical protein
LKGRYFMVDRHHLLTLAVLAAAVAAVMFVRFQAAPVPLERDEGEYALMGQLILDGTPPYSEAASMKLPGIYYAYSAILAVFGQTATGIHLGLMAVNLVSTAILYLLAIPLLGAAGAAMAGAAFVVMSADASVLGLFAHATHFVMMFALAGTWLLLESSGSKRRTSFLFAAGLCFGLTLLMKQSGAFFGLFAVAWILLGALRRPMAWKSVLFDLCALAAGIALPCAAVLAVMAQQGVFDRFWFWTVDYARAYASEIDPGTGFRIFQSSIAPIVRSNPLIWSMAAAGMIGVWLTEAGRKIAPFFILFFLFSFLAVCPGFFFRKHYFVQLLPSAALAAGAALWALERSLAPHSGKSRTIQFSVLVAVTALLLTGAYSTERALATMTPEQFSRSIYGINPFPESVRIAEYLRENTKPEDRIAVMGSEPQICFYAHRKSATEHIYMYGLMEPQPLALRMQEELIAEVEKSKPPFLVLVPVSTSWLRRSGSETKIFYWMQGYLENYRPVMLADIHADHTRWLMDKDAESFSHIPGPNRVIVLKRIKVE